MNKLYTSLFILLFISSSTWAQRPNFQQRPKVQVTGKVIDIESKQALEYATLIFTPVKGKQVTGGITDSKGNFNIEIPVGMYKISVEFLSFKTKTLPQQKITKNIDLGEISLVSDMEMIDEVEIIAEKSTVEIRLDKKIYNVGKDMTVKGGTASDVLENVPSVTVDVEGNVSLRGNESVRILIDGKPSGLVGLNSTDALRQLPAEAIKKVEVITSPSARYDAEGTAGILNIILRRSKAQGFNASVTLTTGWQHNHGASTNINFRAKKFNIFTNLGYNYRDAPGNAYFKNFSNTTGNTISEEIRNYQRLRKRFNSNIGVEYYLTDKASVTGSFLYRNSAGETDIKNEGFKYDNNEISYRSLRNEIEDESDLVYEYAFNFTQKFKGSGHRLTFDASYEDNIDDENSNITDSTLLPENIYDIYEKTANLEDQKQVLLKSDYVLPIGEDQQFEAGFKSNLLHNNTDFSVYLNEDGTTFILDEDLSNVFDYKENIHAVYTQYGNKFGKFSALAGLRMEYTDKQVEVTGEYLDFKKNHTKLFPTLNMTYELKENEHISLGYNRRIRRARSRHINPFPSRSSTSNIFQGNPDLEPIISDGVDLGYLKKWDKLTFNTSIYYQYATDAFQFVREDSGEETEDGIPIIISTPINLNNEERLGFEFSLNYTPIRGVRISNNFNFYNFKTEGSYHGVDYGTNSRSWSNRFNGKFRLLKKMDVQATMFYRGPYENAVSKREALVMANLAFSRDVLKDKGTISFNISDLFNSRKREMETYYENFTNYSEFQWRQRQYKLSFTYRFNQKKKRTRQRSDFNGGDDDFEG